MKKIFAKILIVLLLVLIISCKDGHVSKQLISTHVSMYSDSLTLELEKIKETSVIPGFGVAIVKDSQIIYNQGFGYADLNDSIPFTPKTVNFIASISKTFIGVSIMKLVEMGKLNLDEKVNDILPYDIVHPMFPDIPITVRHLVTHTAGIMDEFDTEQIGEAEIVLLEEFQYDDSRIAEIMEQDFKYYRLGKPISLSESVRKYLAKDGAWYSEDNFRKYPPGTKYEYSNLGADLAAVIVEIKSGLSFSDFTKVHIFKPLKMNNTGWFYKDIDNSLLSKIYRPDDWETPKVAIEHPRYYYVGYSSGDLKSNLEDLSKYLIEMIKGYNGNGVILNKQSYKTLFEPSLDESFYQNERDSSPLNDEYNVGVFWAVSHTGIRLHNGGSIGVYSFLYLNPDTNSGAISFSNLPDASFGDIRDVVYKYEHKMFEKR
ncbi:MAG: serine hydrolase domain-containing protein [Saprospiraceae bacterium]